MWGYPNASDYILNVPRLTANAPSPGVIYSTSEYDPPTYFESVDGLMQVMLRCGTRSCAPYMLLFLYLSDVCRL